MQPTLCSRCHKNVAVIFVTRIEGGETKNEGLCLKCAKELGIKPVEDMMQKMGINDEDLEGLTNEMMSAFGGAEGMEGLLPQEDGDPDEDDEGRTVFYKKVRKITIFTLRILPACGIFSFCGQKIFWATPHNCSFDLRRIFFADPSV